MNRITIKNSDLVSVSLSIESHMTREWTPMTAAEIAVMLGSIGTLLGGIGAVGAVWATARRRPKRAQRANRRRCSRASRSIE
jgi:hypothetical protein